MSLNAVNLQFYLTKKKKHVKRKQCYRMGQGLFYVTSLGETGD